MESISHAIATAHTVKQFIHAEIKATDNKISTKEEAAESKAARDKATSVLTSTVTLVERTLARLRDVKKPEITGKTLKAFDVAKLNNTAPTALALKDSLPDAAKSLMTSMSADSKQGLGSQSQSLSDMATAIQPIITSFDDVLTKPYLDKFSATLNTVPVVGLKNNQIMYLGTQTDPLSNTGTKDVWTYFGALPPGVTLNSQSNVHFFPYKGDFCMSVGTAVWRKRHRGQGDPILQQAVGNWPKMYNDDWEKIGDTAFPAADLLSVVPFAVLAADRNQINFQLLLLGKDHSIQVLGKDDIYPSNTWNKLSYQKGKDDPAQLPTWTRMAYWNNAVVAVDDQNNTWTLPVNFQRSTYTIGEKTAISPTSEFTATDVGPVAVQQDGYLYKRFVQNPPSDGSDPVLQWTRWVQQDGVTNLGVGAPGVLLDLHVLTETLKSRYIDTQTALYPVVNKIKAFAVTHDTYLDLLLDAADKWSNAPDDQKAAQQITAAKGFVSHAKVWAKILNTSIGNTKDTVNIMTAQLHDVKSQLEVQLQILRDKLVGLQNTLAVQQDALSKLKAAFWGAVGAMFLGMALGVIALATGVAAPFVIAAGALFVAGFVAMIALGVKMGELASQISDTQAQINVTQTAITELSAVVKNFTDLDSMYGTLNVFWGRMGNDANSLSTMDDATAAQLGADLFADISSVVAAQKVTKEISNAATLYLDTLNKQGINIPTLSTLLAVSRSPQAEDLTSLGAFVRPEEIEGQFHANVEDGKSALNKGNLKKYHEHMERAFTTDLVGTAASINDSVRSGNWYDIARLSNSAELFNGNVAQFVGHKLLQSTGNVFHLTAASSDGTDPTVIQNRVNAATPVVVGMLQKTNAMCGSVQDLLAKYKQYSASGDHDSIAKLKDSLLQTALDECDSAQRYSAQANNAFADINHACTDYQQGLQRQINGLGDAKNSVQAQANQDSSNIDVPWYVYLGGVAAVGIYIAAKKKEIEDHLNDRLNQLDGSIHQLSNFMQSGASLNNNSMSWTDMAQTVSGCLGSIYNVLTAVSGQVLEDPTIYDSLLTVEWAKVQSSTIDVLNILASRGVSISSNVTITALAINNTVEKSLLAKTAITTNGMVSVTTDEGKVGRALDAPSGLGSGMAAQAKQAQQIFASMQQLLQLPYLSGIIGYWDEQQTKKSTLLDVVTNLRREYVDMMSAEYPVVQNLFTTSLLQETRAELVQDGKLKLDILVKSSLSSARTGQKAISAAAVKFKAASVDFEAALRQLEANMSQIQQKLADVDKNIGDLQKQERDKIIWLIADIVALALASAVILASLGVFGPVAAALTTAQAIGLGATATAAAVKTVVDSLGLADIENLLSALRSTKRDLETTYATLQVVKPLLADVTAGAETLEDAVNDMADGLQDLANDIALMKNLALTDKDVEGIRTSWAEVKESCTQWMDIVNAQGIVPAAF